MLTRDSINTILEQHNLLDTYVCLKVFLDEKETNAILLRSTKEIVCDCGFKDPAIQKAKEWIKQVKGK